jgi:hypothetical protein
MRQSANLMQAITNCNERLVEMCQFLRKHPKVISAKQQICFRNYKKGPVIELYVDVELSNGKALGWWMEIQWSEEKWIVESSVLLNEGQNQDTVREFPVRIAREIEEIIHETSLALVGSVDCLDLVSGD